MMPAKLHLMRTDPILKDIINTVPYPQIDSTQNVFHDLMSCVLEQQIHYRSTKKLFQKMLDQADMVLLTPENFPEFEEKAFGTVKLSMKKYETILNITQHWQELDVKWEELSDQEVKKELSQIKGIGQWTMDMILIYTLQRADVFAYDDFHVKKVMTSLYKLNPQTKLKAQMKEIAEVWSPHKSTAFLYLLEYKTFINAK